MAKFYEEIIVDKNLSVAEIYLEFLGKKHHLATKTTRDNFKTVDVEYYNDILDYSRAFFLFIFLSIIFSLILIYIFY